MLCFSIMCVALQLVSRFHGVVGGRLALFVLTDIYQLFDRLLVWPSPSVHVAVGGITLGAITAPLLDVQAQHI